MAPWGNSRERLKSGGNWWKRVDCATEILLITARTGENKRASRVKISRCLCIIILNIQYHDYSGPGDTGERASAAGYLTCLFQFSPTRIYSLTVYTQVRFACRYLCLRPLDVVKTPGRILTALIIWVLIFDMKIAMTTHY